MKPRCRCIEEDYTISSIGSPLDLRRISRTFKAPLDQQASVAECAEPPTCESQKVDHWVGGSNPHRFQVIFSGLPSEAPDGQRRLCPPNFFGRPTAPPSSRVLRPPSPPKGGTADLRPCGRTELFGGGGSGRRSPITLSAGFRQGVCQEYTLS